MGNDGACAAGNGGLIREGTHATNMVRVIVAVNHGHHGQRRSRWAIPALWIFNIFGSIDFASSIILSRIFQASSFLGAGYWIPVFWVPMLIVGHVIIFKVLGMLKRGESRLDA